MKSNVLIIESDDFKTIVYGDRTFTTESKRDYYRTWGRFEITADGTVMCIDEQLGVGGAPINGQDAENIKQFLAGNPVVYKNNNTDYTDEELAQFEEDWKMGRKQGKTWGSKRGDKTYHIPYNKLKINHIKNIIVWIKARPQNYGPKIVNEMEQLLKRRVMQDTENGKLFYATND